MPSRPFSLLALCHRGCGTGASDNESHRMIHFWKMNGAGNDFVVLDNREGKFHFSRETIARLCHRQFGVGADGLLMVEPARNGADYRMRYYNSDGGEAEMCGNGARCFAKFVNDLNEDSLEKVSFETMAGVVTATFPGADVCVNLSDPFDLSLNISLSAAGETFTVHAINTGVPHAVIFVDDLAAIDIGRLGSAIRNHEHFAPAGSNVNFVQVLEPALIAVRTYERGVEGETLACGTGVAANAIIHHELTGAAPPIAVKVRSGDTLQVEFTKTKDTYSGVKLTGPAEYVFEGEISGLDR